MSNKKDNLKLCKKCNKRKSESAFYKKEKYLDSVCSDCRKLSRKEAYHFLAPKVEDIDLKCSQHLQDDCESIENEFQGENVYKEYKYPDGRILKLTKEEFYKVVEWFRWLSKIDCNTHAANG